jgi:hypothetical protein
MGIRLERTNAPSIHDKHPRFTFSLMEAIQVETGAKFRRQSAGRRPGLRRSCRIAMQASAEMGDRAAVSRYYERWRAYLAGELDVDPAPQTTTIFEQLTK